MTNSRRIRILNDKVGAVVKSRYFLLVVGIILGIAISALFLFTQSAPTLELALRESNLNSSDTYAYIDPLLAVNAAVGSTNEDNALEVSARATISSAISSGNLSTASVMFIDENQGTGFTINPDEKYSPASLLKVPTMIAYYKLAETDHSILSESIPYGGGTDYNLQETILSPVQLQKGNSYTVDELIQHMIRYSDNNAADLLIANLNTTGSYVTTFDKLFKDMGITQLSVASDFITVQAYSLYFRVLYNATYLNRDFSEKALQLLTQTDFSKGIESGVPNNIQVAQKFGEYSLQSSSGTILKRELHDCGIVYYPGHPYLICIMTKGANFTQLNGVIATISRQAFEYMEGKYPNR